MLRKPNLWLAITGVAAALYSPLAVYASFTPGPPLLGHETPTRFVFFVLALAFAISLTWKIGALLIAPLAAGQAEIKAMITEVRNGGYAEGYADGLARKPTERHLNSVR